MDASDAGELRVNVDDLRVTAARYEVSASVLASAAGRSGSGLSCQSSTAAVGAVRAGVGVVRAALSARVADTGVGVAVVDASYVDNDVASAAQVRTLA